MKLISLAIVLINIIKMKSQEVNTLTMDRKLSFGNIVQREISLLSLDGASLRDFKVLKQDRMKQGEVEYLCICKNGKYELSSISLYKKTPNSILCAFAEVILSNFLNKEKSLQEIAWYKNILLSNEINLARIYKRKLTQGLQSDIMKKILVQFLELLNYVQKNSTIQQQLIKYPIIVQIMITTFRCYLFKKQKCDSLSLNSPLVYQDTIKFLARQFHLSYVKQDNMYLFPEYNLVIAQQEQDWFLFGNVVQLPGKCMELNLNFLGKNHEKGQINPKWNYKHKQHIADALQTKLSKRKAYGKQLFLDNVQPSSKLKQIKQPLTPIIKGQKMYRVSFGKCDDQVADNSHQANITPLDKAGKKKFSTTSLFSDQFKTVQSQDQQDHKKSDAKADGDITARFSIEEEKEHNSKKAQIDRKTIKAHTLQFKKHLNKFFQKNIAQGQEHFSLSSKSNTKFSVQFPKPSTPTLTAKKSTVVISDRSFIPKLHKKLSLKTQNTIRKWVSQEIQIPEQIVEQAQQNQLDNSPSRSRKSSSQCQQNTLQF